MSGFSGGWGMFQVCRGKLAWLDVWETCRELILARSLFAFPAEYRDALFPAGMFAEI